MVLNGDFAGGVAPVAPGKWTVPCTVRTGNRFMLSVTATEPNMLIGTPTVGPAALNMSVSGTCFDPATIERTRRVVDVIVEVDIFPLLLGRSGGPKPT